CQAEDGIRDRNVTGVQTCALPISPGCGHPARGDDRRIDRVSQPDRGLERRVVPGPLRWSGWDGVRADVTEPVQQRENVLFHQWRSEERRAGKGETNARGSGAEEAR